MESNLGMKNAKNESVSANNKENSLQASKVSKDNNQACKLQNLGTRIPAKILERFRFFVLNRHGMINGYFAKETANALEFYMNNQQQSTSFVYSQSKSGKPRADKIEKLRQIALELKLLNSYPNVNPFTVANIIKNILGPCDKRTQNSYLKIIKNYSKEKISLSGVGSVFDVTKFVEKIQGDYW